MPQYVTRLQGLLTAVRQKRDRANKNLKKGLQQCGEVILAKANYYVPKDTLALMRSGQAVVQDTWNGYSLAVTYGQASGLYDTGLNDSQVDYALYVHEDLTKKHAAPTQAKFLERAIQETKGQCQAVVKQNLNDKGVELVKDGEVVD